MDDIQTRLNRLGWRLGKGAEKLHPITATQKATLRDALAQRLQQTQGPVETKKETVQKKTTKQRQQAKKQRQSRHH
jgi:hypothetical protein